MHRLRKGVRTAHRLVRVAILQKLDDDVVELDEAHVEPLRAASQIGHADGARVDRQLVGADLLVREQRVLDGIALEVTVPKHLRPTKHLGVEFESPLHILHRQPKVLDTLQPSTKWPAVAGGGRRRVGALRRCRRDECTA